MPLVNEPMHTLSIFGSKKRKEYFKGLSAAEAHGCSLRAGVRGPAMNARDFGKDDEKPEEEEADDDPENEQERP
jgi:hypothetical protein